MSATEVLICDAGTCDRPAQPEHSPCCSSKFHGKSFCCVHYCRTHFVEANPCTLEMHPPLRPVAEVGTASAHEALGHQIGDVVTVGTGLNQWEIKEFWFANNGDPMVSLSACEGYANTSVTVDRLKTAEVAP